ncbi:hypothetical protein ATY37_12770 [Vibrio cidicii]|uniref:Uncharacterized protein n=1 Tax=Vibrio cidicii TaxID=1763883 RepID=A0A151KZN0_9VIBR|nr:hypothetical protein [Vibrio cidicii]EGQ7970967.1 hypothetical protein [Vibrio cholerae]EJL6692150.1 hypothetical protein [Vibrio cholerae]ELL0578831.1 hypothetical protein [Vibrio cholerae]ELT7227081.1 hypothetical protein [Vibrio cholerae]KYN89485.1 hypothetical protein ATY37_12770 [Vibrio cidicii]
MEKLLNKFGYYKRKPKSNLSPVITYREPESPEKNTQRLKEIVAEGNKWFSARTQESNAKTGVFFSIVLLIEHKLSLLLTCIEPDIKESMLGKKIDTLKSFINIYEFGDQAEKKEFKELLPPLHEVKNIRNKLAHDLMKSSIEFKELPITLAYVRKRDKDFVNNVLSRTEDDGEKSCLLLAKFGFMFSVELAHVAMTVEL